MSPDNLGKNQPGQGGTSLASVGIRDKNRGALFVYCFPRLKNIQDRVNRGYGCVKEIAGMLEEMCLGPYHFQSGIILRNSLLLSSLLTNSEAWYGVTNNQLEQLEKVDEALLRNLLGCHSKTARELLYLETGTIPLRYIVMGKRLNYLRYLLNEEEDAMVRRFLEAQITSPIKGDWILTVKENLSHLGIDMSFEAISATSKNTFKAIVKEAIHKKALEYLQSLQSSHSKSKNLNYSSLVLQPYLAPNDAKLSIQEKQFIFSARSRMMDVLCNFKLGQKSLQCRACDKAPEDQAHLIQCEKLSDNEITKKLPQYTDIFSDSVEKIAKLGRLLKQKHEKLKLVIKQDQANAPSMSAAVSSAISNNCDTYDCIGIQ